MRAVAVVQKPYGAGAQRQTRNVAALLELPQQAQDTCFRGETERQTQVLYAWHGAGAREIGLDRVETGALFWCEAGLRRRVEIGRMRGVRP